MIWPFKCWRGLNHKVNRVLKNQEKTMSAIDDLTAEVTKVVASVNAAVAALGNENETPQIAALTAQLAAAQAALDAAVAAKTPVTPPAG